MQIKVKELREFVRSALQESKKKKKQKFKPGAFYYMGATVFEIDNDGKKHARDDIGPDYKGDFKHKFYKEQ